MKKICYRLVFDRKKCLNEHGEALVQVEAYLNRAKKYFTTRIYLQPGQWDHKKRIVKNHPNADGINRMLQGYIAELEKRELALWQQGKLISLDLLGEPAAVTLNGDASFLSFYSKEVESASLKESTKKNHLTTLELLKKYKKKITFAELSFDFIASFDYYLQQKGYHANTIAKHMKQIKRYINIAINKEYMEIQQYPFRKYKIKCTDSRHTHLSPEELNRMEALVLNEKQSKYQQALDAFLFCCYAGLRYSDFVNLTPDNIVNIDKGKWLVYKSVKTQTEVRLPLYLLFEGKGTAILNKYRNHIETFFQLKCNSNINKELLILARLAGVNKHVSFHTARHTNATLLIYSGVNITTVQKLLGHKSVKTTQIYTNVMDRTIVLDLENNRAIHYFPKRKC